MNYRDSSFLTGLFVIFLLPLMLLIVYSFAAGWSFPRLLPESFSFRSYRYLAENTGNVGRALLSSTIYSLLTVLCSLLITLLPARGIARFDFPARRILDALLLMPALVPAMTFSMGVHILFIRFGLSDSYPGIILILTVFSYPYMLRALVIAYQRIPEDYSLAAGNLGGSFLFTLLRVELPMLLPGIAAGASVVFLVAFSDYFLVFLIGGGAVPSYTGYLMPFLQGSDHAVSSLLTLLFLVVPLTLFFLMEGLTTAFYKKRGLES